MGQLNTSIEDDMLADLDRLCAKFSLSRPQFIRQLLTEGIAADAQGRALFEQPQPMNPNAVSEAIRMLNQCTLELDRVLRQSAKRDAAMAAQSRGDVDAVAQVRDGLAKDLHTAISASIAPAHEAIAVLQTSLADQPQLQRIEAQLAEIAIATNEPSNVTVYEFGNWNFSLPAVAAMAAIVVATGSVFFTAVMLVMPPSWLAVPTANRLLGPGDQAICALINYRQGNDGCRIQIDGRPVTISTTKPAAKAP
jgi:hypothetical protein